MLTVAELFAKLKLKLDEESWKKGETAISGIKGLLAGIGITAGAVRGAVEALISHTASAATETSRAAQRVGMAREEFQGLNEAAEHVGVENFEQSMRFLNRSLYAAAHGSHEARRAFAELGIGVSSATRVSDVFPRIVDAFGRLKADDPRRVALAMQLFGRAGSEMLPFLNKGNEGIERMVEHARALGLIFSDEDVKAAAEYKRANLDLKMSIEGLERTIGRKLLPEAGKFAESMAGWIAANREWIATGIHAAVTALTAAWRRLGITLEPLVKAGKWLLSQAWLWKAALAALALVLAVQLGSALRDATFALGRFLASILAVTGAQVAGAAVATLWSLAWVAGIALILGVIEELYGWITGDRETMLEEWFGKFSDFLKDNPEDSPFVKGLKVLAHALEWIVEAAGKVPDAIKGVQRAFGEGLGEKGDSNLRRAFEAAGAGGMQSQWKLAEDPRFSALARAGDYEAISREYRGRAVPAGAPGSSAGPAAAEATPLSVHVEVVAPEGTDDPKAWAQKVGEEVRRIAGEVHDEKLRGMLDPAYEAAAR